MNPEDLLPGSYRITADIAVKAIRDQPKLFDEVLKITLADEGSVSMRGARVIYLFLEKFPGMIQPHLKLLVNRLPDIKTDGVKRCITRIFIHHHHQLDESDKGKLLDICFTWFSDAGDKVALRYYALEILFSLSKIYPEIKTELIACIERTLSDSRKSLQSHGKKMLKKLYSDVNNQI